MTKSSPQEMVIFTRTFDFLVWLLPTTNNFPRAHRHTFTQRLLDHAFDFRERLEEANLRKDAARMDKLKQADETLVKLRLYVRLAATWEWLSSGQYYHGAAMLNEIGKMLGGWQASTLKQMAGGDR